MEKTAIITGANRGIGWAIVKEFAENGYNIWACARKRTEEFDASMSEIAEKNNVEIWPLYFDMTDVESMKAEINEKIFKSKKNIDVLVNNAGVMHGGLFTMTKVQTIREVFEVNLFSIMELTQLILRKMTRQKSGSIIHMSSTSAIEVRPGNSAYGVSKTALKAWTGILAAEVGSYGIRVNAVAPGLADTDMAVQIGEKAGEKIIQGSAMNRLAMPEEIAKAVLFLASEQASFINGETIVVNGGTVTN